MTPKQALPLWNLPPTTKTTLLAQRENRVYRLDVPNDPPTVLRIHRQRYRTDAEINSELQWMEHLINHQVEVPAPLRSVNGHLMETVSGYQVDRLSWLGGKPLGATGEPLVLDNRVETFTQLGEAMAWLHLESDHWRLPEGFDRPSWDYAGLLGEQPVWGRFWENPRFSAAQSATIDAARRKVSTVLTTAKLKQLDYGLIHADLVRENVLLGENGIELLDFDDSGFGFRLFEVATALYKNRSEADYPLLERALIDGYQKVRPLDPEDLALFTLLRSFTYLGWIMSRMHEAGSAERCERFITNAVELAEEYLAT